MDVHIYDGHITVGEHLRIKLDNIKNNVDTDHKIYIARSFIDLCQHSISKRVLEIIVNDIGTMNNYDPSNDLNVDDILYACWDYHEDQHFLNLFEEQLYDMQSGLCSQGRTHRLYQLLVTFCE